MEIIEFTQKYQETTVKFITSILDELHPGENLIDIPRYDDLKDINTVYRGRSKFWLLIKDVEVIGTIAVIEKNQEKAMIQRLFINKTYRRMGYGEKLMKRAINFCKKQQYSYINVITSKQSKANYLLKRLGFKEIGSDGELLYNQLKLT